jgi:tetratricopeptide (TPR) repeat protein
LKDLLLTLSVLGPHFKIALIQQVVPDRDVEAGLNQLMDNRLIVKSQVYPEVEYRFRNVMTQEAAYAILLHEKRKAIHLSVARAIETLYDERIEDHFEELAAHYGQAEDHLQSCRYLIKSGMKAKEAFANEEASTFLNQALALAIDEDLPVSHAEIYAALSEVNELLGGLDDAVTAWERIIDLSDGDIERGNALRNIGRIQDKQGVKEKAIETYAKAAEYLEKFPDALETGMLKMNQSWVLNRLRRFDAALEKASDALKIFEIHNDQLQTAYVHNNLAVIFESMGDLKQALKYNQKSLALFKALGNKRYTANLYLSTGFVLNKMGDNEGALRYFKASLELMDMIGNRIGRGTVLMSLGRCYMDLHRPDEAVAALTQALDLHLALNLSRKIVANRLSLAKAHIQKKDPDSAREHLSAGKALARDHGYISSLARYAHSEAHVLRLEGKAPGDKYQEAIDLFTQIDRTVDASRIRDEMEGFMR